MASRAEIWNEPCEATIDFLDRSMGDATVTLKLDYLPKEMADYIAFLALPVEGEA